MAARADVQQYIGCSQTQAGLIIRALVEQGIVRAGGTGKNIRYLAGSKETEASEFPLTGLWKCNGVCPALPRGRSTRPSW